MNTSSISRDYGIFWKKKEIISYYLSILVFLIHISSIDQYPVSKSMISTVNIRTAFFFKESITRFAVPMFFILSGIAFFRNYNNKTYFSKIKSRIMSLLIPYLIWNILWMVFDICCSYTFISNYFVGRETFVLTFENVFKGIFLYKSNLPFWFVFNLFVFVIISPLIDLLIRNKYVGILSIFTISLLYVFGIHLPASIFFSPISIIFYIIGAFIGKHYFDNIAKKSTPIVQYTSVAFLISYIVLKNLFCERIYIEKPIHIIIFPICAYAVWNTMDLFIEKIKMIPMYSRSFAIYALHTNVSAIIAKLFIICFSSNEWLAIPNFITTFTLTLLIINAFCFLCERYAPVIYSLLMGKRVKTKQQS